MEKYPLQWPVGYPRTKLPTHSRFGKVTFDSSRQKLQKELKMLGASNIVISTNVPLRNDGQPNATYKNVSDTGVAAYFVKDGQQMVLCCDSYKNIDHNLHAICKTVEALRGIERWGVSDFLNRSFQGFKELPSPRLKPWYEVFGFEGMPEKKPAHLLSD